jgi:hypothetical protein
MENLWRASSGVSKAGRCLKRFCAQARFFEKVILAAQSLASMHCIRDWGTIRRHDVRAASENGVAEKSK